MDYLQGARIWRKSVTGHCLNFLSLGNVMDWLLCLGGKPSSVSYQTLYWNLQSSVITASTSCASSATTRKTLPFSALSLNQLMKMWFFLVFFTPRFLLLKEHRFLLDKRTSNLSVTSHLHSQTGRHFIKEGVTKGDSMQALHLHDSERFRKGRETKVGQSQETS